MFSSLNKKSASVIMEEANDYAVFAASGKREPAAD
jgi:hypothetical protein